MCVDQLTGMFQYVVRQSTEVEARFNSVERLQEYITVRFHTSYLPQSHNDYLHTGCLSTSRHLSILLSIYLSIQFLPLIQVRVTVATGQAEQPRCCLLCQIPPTPSWECQSTKQVRHAQYT